MRFSQWTCGCSTLFSFALVRWRRLGTASLGRKDSNRAVFQRIRTRRLRQPLRLRAGLCKRVGVPGFLLYSRCQLCLAAEPCWNPGRLQKNGPLTSIQGCVKSIGSGAVAAATWRSSRSNLLREAVCDGKDWWLGPVGAACSQP